MTTAEQPRTSPPSSQNEHQSDQSDQSDHEQSKERSAPGGRVIYDAIMLEADDELARSTSALFFSGLAAGLSMGLSLITEGLIRHHLPPGASWTTLVAKIGYSVGFLMVILGRQQLFTENTLTPMLPLLKRKDTKTLLNVGRLWAVVLVSNLLGALLVALMAAKSSAFEPEVQRVFVAIGHEAMAHGFVSTMLRAIFAGWLIALMVWMLPFAEAARFFVILTITWVVGIGHFSHIVAGAVDVFTVAWAGEAPWGEVTTRFLVPTLIGNIIGGVMLVAGLNHAQVSSGESD